MLLVSHKKTVQKSFANWQWSADRSYGEQPDPQENLLKLQHCAAMRTEVCNMEDSFPPYAYSHKKNISAVCPYDNQRKAKPFSYNSTLHYRLRPQRNTMPWLLLPSDRHAMHVRDRGRRCRSGFHHPLTTAIKKETFHFLRVFLSRLSSW